MACLSRQHPPLSILLLISPAASTCPSSSPSQLCQLLGLRDEATHPLLLFLSSPSALRIHHLRLLLLSLRDEAGHCGQPLALIRLLGRNLALHLLGEELSIVARRKLLGLGRGGAQ